MTFYGYKRPDGRVGVRNYVLILPASVCASDTTRIIAQQVAGAVTFNNQQGCSQVASDQQLTMDVMAGYAANPNIYGTVVVSLGCENCQMDLVVKAIHEKHTYKEYIGVDACACNLMRPAMYGAYHHITVMGKENEPCDYTYDVVGSLCENNDKFAIDRKLPKIDIGDLLVIHDTGAHGFAMGYNYNGKLKSAEILLQEDGTTRMIRRAETPEDYFRTIEGFDF